MMKSHFQVKCLDCGLEALFAPLSSNCPRCNSEWREAKYDYDALQETFSKDLQNRPFQLWRYRELLPVHNPNPEITLGEGGTPLIRATNLGTMLGCPHLFIKDERQGPTASFKDRQAAVTIAALKEAGITEAVIASTGNVAISYSAYAARAGVKLWAFLTSLVPAEKMREVAIYGTQVVKVTSSYDQAKKVAAEFARQRNFYLDRGTRSIPSVEAMKTIAFEIAEQLGTIHANSIPPLNGRYPPSPWRAPDWYFQSVSGGLGPVGVQKGFYELHKMGLIDKIPAIAGIQTEGCSPMVQAWKQHKKIADPVLSPRTHIATLSTGNPGRTYSLLRERLENGGGGEFESVSDQEAFRAMHVLAKMEGLSTEPAAAVAFAGLFKLLRSGKLSPTDVIVVNCTGHTMPIEPTILGKGWARNVVLPSQSMFEIPEEGLLAALSRVTADKFPSVLIVDDHPEARRLIMRIMQSQGNYALLEASNGREAIDLAKRKQPDLIILDLMMPEMDGFSVLDELKTNLETSNIPVIVVTAKELTSEEKKLLNGRIKSLMQKGSFMDNELLNEIRSAVK
jgi:threonine synthase